MYHYQFVGFIKIPPIVMLLHFMHYLEFNEVLNIEDKLTLSKFWDSNPGNVNTKGSFF